MSIISDKHYKNKSQNHNQTFGRHGENLACGFLENSGFTVQTRNFRTNMGEIDIIAEKNETIYIIEVKTRTSNQYGVPSEIINSAKLRRMEQVAWVYLKDTKQDQKPWQINIIEVMNNQCTFHEVIL